MTLELYWIVLLTVVGVHLPNAIVFIFLEIKVNGDSWNRYMGYGYLTCGLVYFPVVLAAEGISRVMCLFGKRRTK